MSLNPIRRRAHSDEVPVSSFSDIAFLLIIFFILVTSLEKFAGFRAALPAGDKAAESKADEMPTVKVDNGRIYYADRILTIDELRAELDALKLGAKAREEERIVIIEATGAVAYQTYYEIMAAISTAQGVVGIVKEGE